MTRKPMRLFTIVIATLTAGAAIAACGDATASSTSNAELSLVAYSTPQQASM